MARQPSYIDFLHSGRIIKNRPVLQEAKAVVVTVRHMNILLDALAAILEERGLTTRL